MFFSPVRLRAERKAGELDKRREKAQGRWTDLVPPGTQVDGPPPLREKVKGSSGNQYTGPVPAGNQSTPPTLRDLGISKRQAHDWR